MPRLDPLTAIIVSTLMMLANGTLLGLMHRDLPSSMRPAAVSWLAGTLVLAAGSMAFALPPTAWAVTLANGLTLVGLTAYWRSLRQFYGYPSKPWLVLPAVLATAGLYVFAAFEPNVLVRIFIGSTAWIVIMGGCLRILRAGAGADAARSRRVLAVIYAGVMAFTVVRAIYFATVELDPSFAVADNTQWMNVATSLVVIVLPIVGSTAFVLMCSERVSRQWERAATTDYLTGLPNRRTVTEAGARRFGVGPTRLPGGALAVLDVDRFKPINDAYGHGVGDEVLKHVAGHLAATTRAGELLGRVGGEEFVVLMDDVITEHGAVALAERLRRAVQAHPYLDGDLRLEVTVSVGVAVAWSKDEDFDSLLRRADRALYAAKTGGRNRVEVAAAPARAAS